MEPGVYIFALVLAVGVFHIACNVATFFTKKHENQETDKSRVKKRQPVRDDWYMFFHRSDLIGKETEKEEKNKSRTSSSSNLKRRNKRRAATRSIQA